MSVMSPGRTRAVTARTSGSRSTPAGPCRLLVQRMPPGGVVTSSAPWTRPARPHQPAQPSAASLPGSLIDDRQRYGYWDASGKTTRAEWYYDQVGMLVQLGHMQPPEG